MKLPLLAFAASLLFVPMAQAEPVHGLNIYGNPKYPATFTHFDYVNPSAPKGGEVRLSAIGTFDSLNPFILKGTSAGITSYTFDTLGVSSEDEPFSMYGLLAESMDIAPDKASMTVKLRREAKFHDGSAVTSTDVAFSFTTLRDKGAPVFRSYYADITAVETPDPQTVIFRYKDGTNRELPLITLQMPILSKAWYSTHPFDETTMTAPLGSGPYKVVRAEAGRSIVYERDPGYWGKDLAVNRGKDNFDRIRVDYFRDETIAMEAFFAGQIDWRRETTALRWTTGYDKPPVRDGRILKESFQTKLVQGMQGFSFNIRRPQFADPRVRQALTQVMDFEWMNKTLFSGLYKRSRSYFDNSEMAATGLPSPAELKLLEPWRGKIPEEVFTHEYKLPVTDGSGSIRPQLREALSLLKQAGWEVKGGKLTDASGKPFTFEIMLVNPAFERVTLPYAKNLEQLGITASVRVIDPAQYQRRIENYDFDVTVGLFAQSESPGNEQREFFGSAAADLPGTRNIIGIKSQAVDDLIEKIIYADSREALVTAARALDRVLQWGHYQVPQWYLGQIWVAHWDMFGKPEKPSKYGYSLEYWWVDPAKAGNLGR
jgi:microcin C transport system substrate-binding protein